MLCFFILEILQMAIENFDKLLEDALQGNENALSSWKTYADNQNETHQEFTEEQLKQTRDALHQIIKNNNASNNDRANAFFLRGILCVLGQYHTPAHTQQQFLLTAEKCYQEAHSLGHPHAEKELQKLQELRRSQNPITNSSTDSLTPQVKISILRPFLQYLHSRTSWWGKIITFFFRNRDLTNKKIEQAQAIQDTINHTCASSYADLSAYLQLISDIHIGTCAEYKHNNHANLEQNISAIETHAQHSAHDISIRRRYTWFTQSNFAECLHKGIRIADSNYDNQRTLTAL